jgi:hypothetical protein
MVDFSPAQRDRDRPVGLNLFGSLCMYPDHISQTAREPAYILRIYYRSSSLRPSRAARPHEELPRHTIWRWDTRAKYCNLLEMYLTNIGQSALSTVVSVVLSTYSA